MGLREQKKIQTRKDISNIATSLFIERGYHEVTTAEIAAQAQVSVPTLFNYFPTKESLVFDEDHEIEKKLIDAVIRREKGLSILESLLSLGLETLDSIEDKKSFSVFMTLVDGTPELSAYARQMWLRHEKSLAKALHKESIRKLSLVQAESIARFVLDSYHRAMGQSKSKATLRALFAILAKGWNG